MDMAPIDYLFLAVLVLLLVLGLVVALVLRRIQKRFAALIIFLASLYAILFTVSAVFFSFSTYSLSGPIAIVRDVIPVIIGLLFTFRFFSSHIFAGFTGTNTPNYSSPAVLKETVSKILDSENLLTALRATLPVGKDDEKFGFDHIPFILSTIDERRKRAQRSAKYFLIATTLSALIFSAVVMYFGYILVNEASAGTAKTLADIKDSTESTSQAIHTIIPGYYNNADFQKTVVPFLDQLIQLQPGEKNRPVKDKVINAINASKRTGDFTTLNSALTLASSETSEENDQEKTYSSTLDNTVNSLAAFVSSQQVAIPELNSRIQELKVLIPKAEEALSKPENRVPEIIKRLALGLVIATFFLALLRYMGTLYRTRYQQVLAAENDDFMIRRFYVAFKSSEASDEQRKAVLSGFMAAQGVPSGGNAKESADGTKEQYEILKDLFGALSKKL